MNQERVVRIKHSAILSMASTESVLLMQYAGFFRRGRSAVFYDPPSTLPVLGSDGKPINTQHHMIFNTKTAEKQARVLLDTRASQCFISKDFCESMKLQSVAAPTSQQVKTTIGTEILTQTLCQVSFQLQCMGVLVSPLVVPLPVDFTVILGDNWLRDRGAVMNYAE